MTSGIDAMVLRKWSKSEGTKVLHTLLSNLQGFGLRSFVMNFKLLNLYIRCMKCKMTIQTQTTEAIYLGQWAVLLDIKSAYFHFLIVERHKCLFVSDRRAKIPSSDSTLRSPNGSRPSQRSQTQSYFTVRHGAWDCSYTWMKP